MTSLVAYDVTLHHGGNWGWAGRGGTLGLQEYLEDGEWQNETPVTYQSGIVSQPFRRK